MELLATTSSIAGLLSLTGQCLSGASKLRAFYHDLTDASKTVKVFFRDIDSLVRTLHDVRLLLDRIAEHGQREMDSVRTMSLKIQLEDCGRDLEDWIATAYSLRPPHGNSCKAWFRKFWLAVDKDSTTSIRTRMQLQRTDIALALDTLGRWYDIHAAQKAHEIEREIRRANEGSEAVLERTNSMHAMLERMERSLSHLSMVSMASSGPRLLPRTFSHKSIPSLDEGPDTEQQESVSVLLQSSWDAALLGEWTDTQDRINRWLLHTLGTHRGGIRVEGFPPEPDQAKIHQLFLREVMDSRTGKQTVPCGRSWGRFVMKYWLLDEVATGSDPSDVRTPNGSVSFAHAASQAPTHSTAALTADRIKPRSASHSHSMSSLCSERDQISGADVFEHTKLDIPITSRPKKVPMFTLGNSSGTDGSVGED